MCQGVTLKGTACKRKDEPYCKDHKPIVVTDSNLDISSCTLKIQKKIVSYIKKGPSKSDSEGHIYVYYLKNDAYFKVGRTARDVDKRLKEWKGAILKKSWKVKFQKLAEKLIHAYLDHVRVYRYKLENDKICSIWKSTREPITEKDEKLKERYKLEARTKMIEWFNISWPELEQTIECIIKNPRLC
jgi:hypothetical protein